MYIWLFLDLVEYKQGARAMSNEIWIQIVFALTSYVQLLLQLAITLHISGTMYGIRRLLFSAVLITAVFWGISTLFSPSSLLLISIWMLILILIYRFVFKETAFKSVLMGAGQMMVVTQLENIIHLVPAFIGGDLQSNFYSYSNQIIGSAAFTCILALIYFVVRRIKFNFAFINRKREKQILWVVYVLFLLLFTWPNVIGLEQNRRTLSNGVEIYNLMLFILFFLYNLIYIRSLLKMASISQQLEVQQLYSATLEKSSNDLRGFKHDFVNILNTIGGLADIGNLDALQTYMQNLSVKFLKISTTDIVNTSLKDNPILYGVMLSKMSLAEVSGIEFRTCIQSTVNLKYCDPVDFSRMIGILLDNALESAEESEQKRVDFSLSAKHGLYTIVVRNSCVDAVSTQNIFKRGFTTKKNHSGIGLSQIEEIIKKYRKKGYATELRTECRNNVFTQTLIL